MDEKNTQETSVQFVERVLPYTLKLRDQSRQRAAAAALDYVDSDDAADLETARASRRREKHFQAMSELLLADPCLPDGFIPKLES